jgi:hypothetical protein
MDSDVCVIGFGAKPELRPYRYPSSIRYEVHFKSVPLVQPVPNLGWGIGIKR